MPYQYADRREDYSDFASGKVFYNLPGHPAFPIRLASEIFQRCLEIRRKSGLDAPVRIYDPLCGGAYHLATLAFFHWDQITEIIVSDVDTDALAVAQRNLSLLTMEGIEQRIHVLERMHADYGKASHAAAVESARRLQRRLEANLSRQPIPFRLFEADAFDPMMLARGLGADRPDLVITDIPYGQQSDWRLTVPLEDGESPAERMLAVLARHLSKLAVVAIASPKQVKVSHPQYTPMGKLKLGLRQVTYLQYKPTRV